MIKVFAKQGTDEKAILDVKNYHVAEVQRHLNSNYGGNWVWVEELKIGLEVLLCKDNVVYNGFDNRDGRYANIKSLLD